MKKYLIGDPGYQEMYPFVFVDTITKDDLLRCKSGNHVIINIIDGTVFDAATNSWEKIAEYSNYKDQW